MWDDIDNQNQKTGPKTETHFQLPVRQRFSAWYVVVPILLILALIGGWFLRVFVHEANAPEPTVFEQPKEEDQPTVQAHYLTQGEGENSKSYIYGYSENASIADKKIAEADVSYLAVLGKLPEPNLYAARSSNGDILTLDIGNGKTSVLIKAEAGGLTSGYALSEDKTKIAYGVTYEGTPYQSEIWVYDLESKQKTQLVKKTEMQIYQGFAPRAWRKNDAELVVSAIGGDAGAIWGDIYTVNSGNGELTKINPIAFKANEFNTFLIGKLSPDKSQWLFTYCAAPDIKAEVPLSGCPAGAELRTYDFESKQMKVVYQNLRYDNNADKGILRNIMSADWIDDTTVAAAVPGAMLSIDINSKDKITELLTYDGSVPQNFTDNPIDFVFASKERIVYRQGEETKIYNSNSHKIETINLTGTKQRFSDWLE